VRDATAMIGSRAIDFELREASERPIRLSDELRKARTILLFYPNDFGIICTVMLKRFKDEYSMLQGRGFEVIGINTSSPYTHRTFKNHLALPFPLLSDENGSVSELYSGIIAGGLMKGKSNRAAFIIDRDRNILLAWIAPDPNVLPDIDAIIAAALALAER
jgi:peroxiredoxin Q/BCP